MAFDPRADYPLGLRRPDLVHTPAGTPLSEVTWEASRDGRVSDDELRATPATLARQAAVALASGRTQLAENLVRASELATVPDELVLQIYTALRPHRSTAADLDVWAERLEREHDAPVTAAYLREAAAVYAQRGLLATAPGERAAV